MNLRISMFILGLFSLSSIYADDFQKAPPSFEVQGVKYAPIDILKMNSVYTFDLDKQKTFVRVLFEFRIMEKARPLYDSCCLAQKIDVDGDSAEEINVNPYSGTSMKSVTKVLEPGVNHRMTVDFELENGVDFNSNGSPVNAGFFMSDIEEGGRSFWEKYGLANLEFDQYPHQVDVKIDGELNQEMMLITNGKTEQVAKNYWVVNYPDYFTTSSPYFHLFEKTRFCIREKSYQGVEKSFPVIVYSSSCSTSDSAMKTTFGVIAELEKDYGGFAHDKYTAYITGFDGGMEYCGATITSSWALPHEITHSWFARGVMPADGNAGWIDEAVASWRDNGYPRYESIWWIAKLSGFHPYHRHTVMASYNQGANFIGYLDYVLQSFGMKSLLKDFYKEKRRSVVHVSDFQTFLEKGSSENLKDKFDTYVYGLGANAPENNFEAGTFWFGSSNLSRHPKPFTEEELQLLR